MFCVELKTEGKTGNLTRKVTTLKLKILLILSQRLFESRLNKRVPANFILWRSPLRWTKVLPPGGGCWNTPNWTIQWYAHPVLILSSLLPPWILTIYSNCHTGALFADHTDSSDRDLVSPGCCECVGHFMIPRQQWLLFLLIVLLKKPHEMYKAVRRRVLFRFSQDVGMKRDIEPRFLTNDHCMWRVNIDCWNGI